MLLLFLAVHGSCNGVLFYNEPQAPTLIEINRASFLHEDTHSLPAADDPRWRELNLPDIWGQRSAKVRGGWYRLRFRCEEPPTEAYGIYLVRLHMNAAVYFNGVFVGDGGRFAEPMARNWNTPLYFTLGAGLWRRGENEVWIRLRTYPSYGLLPPVAIGPERVLRPRYERRHFLQNEVSAILCFGLIGLSLFMFGIWWRRRKDTLYLWFAGANLLWALYSSYLFIRNPIVPGRVFQWFAHACLDWWIVIFAGFVHRFTGVQRRRLERSFIGLALLGTLLTGATLGLSLQAQVFGVSHVVAFAVAVYLAVFVWRSYWRQRTPELTILAATFTLLLITGVHDWLLNMPFEWWPLKVLLGTFGQSFLFLHYSAPAVFFFLAWHLTRRFVSALNESELLNTELEERVERGRQQLERSFAERRLLEREQAATEARERVYRDLHDDIGAKLLSLVYGADSPVQADLARAALQDLRSIVSHTRRGPTSLVDLLADWRAELAQRVSEAHLEFRWEEENLPELLLPADIALGISRIIRESVSNVLRHARASRVHVNILANEELLVITIRDDGVGMDAASVRQGQGMRSLAARAAQLGGSMDWRAETPHGCCVAAQIPLARLVQAPP